MIELALCRTAGRGCRRTVEGVGRRRSVGDGDEGVGWRFVYFVSHAECGLPANMSEKKEKWVARSCGIIKRQVARRR